jgi:hypothetical protein
VAGTLLYCCAVIRHLEQKPKKWVDSLRSLSCCLPQLAAPVLQKTQRCSKLF